ncbi:cellulose biosynthesis cyclic di-GMP-binding regulatory protein BcsB [Acidihalobacter aeolianus]|nr:cellulose biosynthesis cyclic di-GMP-binding regulatory protein BcsB [Acidihalobacter aeolianus]
MNHTHGFVRGLPKLIGSLACGILLIQLSMPSALAATTALSAAANQATPSDVVSLTLQDIGQPDGIRLQGADAVKTLYLPENPSLKAATLQLHLRFAPEMPTGKLWIESNHRVLAEESIPRTETSVWSVPLMGAMPVDGVVPLEIHMVVDNPNVCQAMAGNWMDIGPDSVLSFTQKPQAGVPPINQFFPVYLKTVYIVVPEMLGSGDAQAVLDVASYITHRYAVPPRIVLVDKRRMPPNPAFSRTVILGGTQLGVVRLDAADNRHTYLALQLGPDPVMATQAVFRHARLMPAMAVTSATDLAVSVQNPAEVAQDKTTFAQLGYPDEQVQGVGTLNVTYRFSQTDLGGAVKDMAVRFAGVNSPLPEHASGYISVKFNGVAIYAQPIDGTRYDFYASVPAGLMKRDNVVQLSFAYTPGGGNCTQGSLPFMGMVRNASYLQFNRSDSLPGGFDRFPVAFAQKMPVYLQSDNRTDLAQAVALLEAMQKTVRMQLHPMVVGKLPDSGPVLYVGETAPSSAFLQIKPFELRDTEGKTLLRYVPGSRFAALEAYGQTLVLAGPPKLRAALLSRALVGAGWYELHGDTVLQGVSGHPVQARMMGKGLEIQPLPVRPDVFWQQYRYWFIVLFGLLVVAILVWLYPRLVRKGGPAGS